MLFILTILLKEYYNTVRDRDLETVERTIELFRLLICTKSQYP